MEGSFLDHRHKPIADLFHKLYSLLLWHNPVLLQHDIVVERTVAQLLDDVIILFAHHRRVKFNDVL